MKKFLTGALIYLLVLVVTIEGHLRNKTLYVGGTVDGINERTIGVATTNEKFFAFRYGDEELKIAYERMNQLYYGEKVGPPIDNFSPELGVGVYYAPWDYLLGRHKYFLTLRFKDDQGAQRAILFELGKDVARTTLASLEERTHRKIDYQNERARKSAQR